MALAVVLPTSCEILKEGVDDSLLSCGPICTKIQDCDVTPPVLNLGSLGEASSGSEGLDCAGGCAAPDRELRGYSDCQIQCIEAVECDEIEDCWRPSSDAYAKHCLSNRDIPAIQPDDDDPQPQNGTNTGNEEVDVIVEDPAVAIAVEDAKEEGFELNYGDHPPMLVGKYRVSGQIDAASNARPEGSRIETAICFWDYTEGPGGVHVSYCEDNVPGEDTAPLTGSEDGFFTAYFEFDGATILFSGQLNPDGTTADDVEALVVYTYTTDSWELSHTDWELQGDCDSCL